MWRHFIQERGYEWRRMQIMSWNNWQYELGYNGETANHRDQGVSVCVHVQNNKYGIMQEGFISMQTSCTYLHLFNHNIEFIHKRDVIYEWALCWCGFRLLFSKKEEKIRWIIKIKI